ncbi:DUF4438 domain-containing protein [Schnuerera ultunensis]|uniref:DUF4438 domain-containing protein n=1 Tax=[Clostridium] ultunense Esp TaxID=1288971 RepID=A0A1M4PSU5_9FIRM|nr:DUF4438 domain-containing protein [Schnuerera ultunensis]SHD78551.1 conserved protein of unknown function [[Clostridium] ultunense Esp]
MLNTNESSLVKISVQGIIQHPGKARDFIIDGEGRADVLPATGGICYNVKVGDCCMNLAGDHVEPGVSTSNDTNKFNSNAYNIYSCIGNEATVITGDAKGSVGYVTGKHDLSNVLIYFDDEALKKMTLDDKILVKGYGVGFKLLDYPNVKVMNIDPDLFKKFRIEEKDGKIIVPVAKKIPAYLMGSGIGAISAYRSDYDIMTQDRETIKELGLEDLKFGDIVLLENCDNTYGRCYFKGAATIGIVAHGDCIMPGHGPGVTTILSSRESVIEAIIDKSANIANYHPLTKDRFK